jgi:hypothetical protein
MNSHGMALHFTSEVQLEIHLGPISLKIREQGRIPADLFRRGNPYMEKIARSEQLRDR